MAITGGKAATSLTLLSSHHNTKSTATKYPRNVIFTFKNARKTLSSLHFQGQVAGSKLQAIAASSPSPESENQNVPLKSVSVILLAGGKGKRMGANIPKQYLPLLGRPIVLYSFSTFSIMPEVKEIVVVCDPSYRGTFEDASQTVTTTIKFASPGQERQDSVFNGLKALLIPRKRGGLQIKEVDDIAELVCVHDSARPLVLSDNIKQVFKDAWIHGAAVLGVPAKATIKEANSDGFVVRTLNRATLWEMQTPQVMKPNLLRNGFEVVYREGLQVTDDVSIVEHLKQPVYITQGCYTNIKVTTPDDLIMAQTILNRK